MNDIENVYGLVNRINTVYQTLHDISDDQLRQETKLLEENIKNHLLESLDIFLVKAFAIVKETARRLSERDLVVTATDYDKELSENFDFVTIKGSTAIYNNKWSVAGVPLKWDMVHYDEQLLGGIYLHYGYAIEMGTGEGKTLTATLPVFLNALTHKGVHLMTVNDYLSKRDYETTRPIYMFHGLSTDCIECYYRGEPRRKEAYKADITFGTNSSFTFDYLYDHLALMPEMCVQHEHYFAIIDELDSVLIDEADTPHIVGVGNNKNNGKIYEELYPIVEELITTGGNSLYTYDFLKKEAYFTSEGMGWISSKLRIENLFAIKKTYEIDEFELLDLDKQNEISRNLFIQNVLHKLLLALTVYERDVDYIVADNKVLIIDQHTGRLKLGNRWEHGLHSAIEIKEGVNVESDFDGIAVISLKNYYRLYNKICGMSGTIMPVKDELLEIYGLRCAVLPPHKPIIRIDEPIKIFKDRQSKDKAIIAAIRENMANGRPTLVGSISIKRSEQLCNLLDEESISYNKLNAKTLDEEAKTVAKAGIGTTVTVSTSVAGRGTDIKPSKDALHNGGLMVIGADLFESIRVDKQLKGRTGRQGNPGNSIFFVSLEDDILKNLSSEDSKALADILKKIDDVEIHAKEVRFFFEKAQSNRENYFKYCRKESARKDDIIAPLRSKFYYQRNAVLFDACASNSIISEILHSVNSTICEEDINLHLKSLYSKVKELIIRRIRNNPDMQIIKIAFTEELQPFAICLDLYSAKDSFDYFVREYKRQIILQVYDKHWKDFVLYLLENLDQHEINLLGYKYNNMMAKANTIILNRLYSASIPFEGKDKVKITPSEQSNEIKQGKPTVSIESDRPCPCGSGKKFCECHGINIRSKKRIKIRR